MNRKIILNAGLLVSVILFLASGFMAFPYAKTIFRPRSGPKGPVRVEKADAGWRLTVGGEPFFVKGVCYRYTPIGKGERYDFFANPQRPWIVDGAMMRDMGVNSVRIYEPGKECRL